MKTTYPTQTHRLLNGGTTDREAAMSGDRHSLMLIGEGE